LKEIILPLFPLDQEESQHNGELLKEVHGR
jgi:hypothetical protein